MKKNKSKIFAEGYETGYVDAFYDLYNEFVDTDTKWGKKAAEFCSFKLDELLFEGDETTS